MIKVWTIVTFSMLCMNAVGQRHWQINKTTSTVGFTINGPFGIAVEGALSSPDGMIIFDPLNLSKSSFNIAIESNSINTNNRKRDEHLRKPAFFDIANYKTIHFTSNKIEKTEMGYAATGILKVKDKARTIKLTFTFIQVGNNGNWKSKFTLNRLDYGVGTSSMMMGDDVTVLLDVSASVLNAN